MRKASLNPRDESDASKQACIIRAERGRAFILSAVAGGQSVAKAANTVKTNQKHARAWSRWNKYLQHGGVRFDPFLQSPHSCRGIEARHFILGFAFVLRYDWFGSNGGRKLTAGVVRQYVGAVCQAFVRRGLADPSRVKSGDLRPEFEEFFRACEKVDPAPNRKSGLQTKVFAKIRAPQSQPISHAIGELVNGAVHFAMRACEYTLTTDSAPLTKLLTLRDIIFLKNGRPTANRAEADHVMIIFHMQKNGKKEEAITRKRSSVSSAFCPVRTWAGIVDRILSYPGTTLDSPVNTVQLTNGSLGSITGKAVSTRLKAIVSKLDSTFPLEKVTAHSIRATYATMLFRQGASLETVKLMGRWKSDAFLSYIRQNSLMVDVSEALQACDTLNYIPVNN